MAGIHTEKERDRDREALSEDRHWWTDRGTERQRIGMVYRGTKRDRYTDRDTGRQAERQSELEREETRRAWRLVLDRTSPRSTA